MPTTLTHAERVAAGAAVLDAHYGPEWRSRINIATLYLGDVTNCILGQLEGDFFDGIDLLGLPLAEESDYTGDLGLDSYFEYEWTPGQTDQDYAALTLEWAREVGRIPVTV